MAWFPMFVDLTGKTVLLIGDGPQIREKEEKLRPFGPEMVRCACFSAGLLSEKPAMVVVGDTEAAEAAKIAELCRAHGIPVNVVDRPDLCDFYFPALILREPLTVALSTGGQCPAAAGYLRRELEQALPDRTEEILRWLADCRPMLRSRGILKQAAETAFRQNRPLTQEELECLKAHEKDTKEQPV